MDEQFQAISDIHMKSIKATTCYILTSITVQVLHVGQISAVDCMVTV